MKQVLTNTSQEEYLRILGKGMVTIPKAWRDELGLEEGEIVKARKEGAKVVIEAKSKAAHYRNFSDAEIEQWLKADRFPPALAKRVEKKKALRNIKSTRNLLGLAGIIPKGSGLPADLSAKHNEYTWD